MPIRVLFAAMALLVACEQPTAAEPAPAGDPAPAPAAQGHRSDIALEDFAAKHAAGVRLIDVRTPQEYAAGHVPGAVLVPLDALDPAQPPLSEYPKDEELYVICQTGRRSSTAADRLAEAGYTTVNVKGGTSAWLAGGHPVER